jgi:hypothetical protein
VPTPATPEQPPAAPATATQPEGESVVFVGAGDIAKCEIIGGARGTARLLDQVPGTVFTVGDNAYDHGSAKEFKECYEPTWGRHKARTRPALGNHDKYADNGRSYYAYFGENAGPPGRGYYSYDLGAWHIIALDSTVDDIGENTDQTRWLKEDLEKNATECILAYWHAPLFSSGPHGSDPRVRGWWKLLYDAGAEIVLNGHDHTYERFAPQDPGGKVDEARGVRQFVVGTGGGGVYRFKRDAKNSEVKDNSTYGVLKLTLHPGKYDWVFLPIAGQSFTDSGSGTCSPKTD